MVNEPVRTNLRWESTVSCLFAIYNLWPLQLDCVCCERVGGGGAMGGVGGVAAHGSASKGLLVEALNSCLLQLPIPPRRLFSVESPAFTALVVRMTSFPPPHIRI